MFANIIRTIKRYLTLEKTKGGVSFLSDGDERITRSLICGRVTTNIFCLRRRNNEFNELTNFLWGAWLGRSTVAHFARKVRGTNIVAAKHELKIQQSHAPERWSCSLRVRGPHFASKVSYNAGAATDDYAALTQISAARALLPIFNLEHPKVIRWPSILLLFSECPPAFGRASSRVR